MTKTAKFTNSLILATLFFFSFINTPTLYAGTYSCAWTGNGTECILQQATNCSPTLQEIQAACDTITIPGLCSQPTHTCPDGNNSCSGASCPGNPGGGGGSGSGGSGGVGGGGAPAPNPDLPDTVPAGIKGDCSSPDAIDTAIGCIHIGSADDLAADFITWALSLSGGAAFLLIVYAGFQIMTSRGNPKKIELGKDLMWSAIGGLLLIIFSAFILRIVGVEIFAIFPGGGSA